MRNGFPYYRCELYFLSVLFDSKVHIIQTMHWSEKCRLFFTGWIFITRVKLIIPVFFFSLKCPVIAHSTLFFVFCYNRWPSCSQRYLVIYITWVLGEGKLRKDKKTPWSCITVCILLPSDCFAVERICYWLFIALIPSLYLVAKRSIAAL